MTAKNKIALYSWAFYDFANTIFSAIVLTSYFPLYLTELSKKNIYLGLATTGSMILAGLTVPFFGALSDQTGKTKKYLLRTTLGAILFLCLFSFTRNPTVLIFLFFVACFFYHASLVFYNSLLSVSAPEESQGFASGLGTGLGYLGVVITIPIAHYVDIHWGRAWVFALSGILFLLASIPLFVFVPERPVPHPSPFRWQLWTTEWAKILQMVRGLGQKPAELLFFGGNFFMVDAVNSMIFWFMVYAREVFQPEQAVLVQLLVAVNVAAFLYGILAGFLTDRIGAMKTLIFSGILLTGGLFGLSYATSFSSFILIALSAGAFALSGIWTAGRKALLELAPPQEVGSYFGLYGLTTKISVIGSLIFSVIADFAGFRQALWTLAFPALFGTLMMLFSKVLKKK